MNLLTKAKIAKAIADESGAGTFFAMTFAFVCIAIGGLAVDASNVWSVRQRLQSATDIAAHAAAIDLVFPDTFSPDESTADVAIATLLINMPDSKFGTALQASDVVIGYWDTETHVVTDDSTTAGGESRDRAVGVTARLDGNVGNVVPTFLLRLVGFDYWRVATTAVFVRDTPDCFEGGFIAGGIVDIASNNEFVNSFCIHGNQGVDVNDHVVFGEGVRLSMPNSNPLGDGGMLALKGSDYTWLDGKENQIGDQYLEPSLASTSSIDDMIANLKDPNDPNKKDYITDNTIYDETMLPNDNRLLADVAPVNAVTVIDCPNSGLDISADEDLSNRVLIVDCKVNIEQGAELQNMIIVTTDTSNQSISAPAAVTIGLDDHCAEGGEVSLITMGDVHMSGQNAWNGAQVIANGDVHISANGNGIEGISVEAAGDIFATSNLGFGLCNTGVDPYITDYSIRMVY